MVPDRRGGPAQMESDELVALLSEHPSGALCMVSAKGTLQAWPARVHSAEAEVVHVNVVHADTNVPSDAGQACLVVDQFGSYEGIRGAMIQGAAGSAGTGTIDISISLVVTFSFGATLNARQASSGEPTTGP
jgi:hypothetical protein